MSRSTAAARQEHDAQLVRTALSTGQISMVVDLLESVITLEGARFGKGTDVMSRLQAANIALHAAHNLACARGRV